MRRAGRVRQTAIALGAIAALAVAGAPATQAGKPKKGPTVKVADDFYSPTDVKVKPNTRVTYKWDSENLNPHNVVIQKGPKKIDKSDFKSATGAIGIKFKPVFEKQGTYEFLCTFHPDVMKMKVTVKK